MRQSHREKDTGRQREQDRDRDRERDRDNDTDTHRQRQIHTERDREAETKIETETERAKDTQTHTNKAITHSKQNTGYNRRFLQMKHEYTITMYVLSEFLHKKNIHRRAQVHLLTHIQSYRLSSKHHYTRACMKTQSQVCTHRENPG